MLVSAVHAQSSESTLLPPFVGYTTAECPSAEGENSPDNPIRIENFSDIYGSALIWETPERGQRENEWERENDIDETPDLNCKWVRIAGHFRMDNYQHYRGALAASANDLYTNGGGPGNLIRERIYFVESWAQADTRSALINGADIEITAQFYDLCRYAEQEVKRANDGRIIMSGPCHYGRFTGLMLRDAKIERVLSPSFKRVRGEINRSVIGDIREIDRNWPDMNRVKDAALERIALIRSGPRAYWEDAYSGVASAEKLAADKALDQDNWISFLSTHADSPLTGRFRQSQFKVFRLKNFGGGESEETINIAVACFCTVRSCKDEWPLFWADATSFYDKYLCLTLHRDHQDRTRWR